MMHRVAELYKFRDWLEERTSLSKGSVYIYFNGIRDYLTYCDGDPLDIDNLNWFIAEHTYKKRSTHYYSVIRKYIAFKFQNASQKREDMYELLLKPKPYHDIKRERQYLSDEQIMDLLNCIENLRFRIIAMLQALTAARAGGILSIRRNGVSVEQYKGSRAMKLVTTEKGDKRNVVYLFDPIAISVVEDYLRGYDANTDDGFKDYIFMKMPLRISNAHNLFIVKRLNYMRYYRGLKEALNLSKVARLDMFATHDFRRCLSRKVWEKYKDVNVLQRVLNHEDPSTTLRYLKQSGLQNIDVFREMQS